MEDKGTSMATGLAERRFWAVVARLGGALVLVLVPVVLVLKQAYAQREFAYRNEL
jgi:hypothetical protein